jgi:hypothetical protein
MSSIFEEIKNSLYTLDHDMELSPGIFPPCSDLARVPYFVFAETLTKVWNETMTYLSRHAT